MGFAAQAEGVVAADFERFGQNRRIAEGVAVAPDRLGGDLGAAGALDGGGGAGEIAGDEFALQADRVEDLGAAIGLVGRDAHLGHDLEQALVDRLDVAVDGLLRVDVLGQVARHGGERVEGEIGVDRLGAVAGQHAEVMHLAGLAGLDHQADRGPQAAADEVMVHAGGGEQRRNRHAVGPDHAVGQDDDVDAGVDGLLGRGAQHVERRAHALGAAVGRIGDVERLGLERVAVHVADGADLLQVLIGEDRLAHLEPLAPALADGVEQVGARADEGDQAHHQLLADRIDRRVGDLGEVLLEIGVEQLRLVRHRRDRHVVAHRADGLLAGDRHRGHQQLEVFLGVAEGLLAIEQRHVGARCRCAAPAAALRARSGCAPATACRAWRWRAPP